MTKAKNISYVLLGQVAATLSSFLLMPFLVRRLSYELYGTYGQIFVISAFIEIAFAVGLPITLYAYLSAPSADDSKVFSSNYLPTLIFGVAASLLLFFFSALISSAYKNPDMEEPLRLYCWIFPFLIPLAVLQNFLIFKNKIRQVVFINLVANTFRLIVSCFIIHFYHESLLPLFYFLIAYQAALFFIYSGYTFLGCGIKLQPELRLSVAQMKTGVFIASKGLIGSMIFLTNSYLISTLLSTTDFAIYRSGALEVPLLSTIYASIGVVILPEIHKLWAWEERRHEIVALKRKIINYCMLINFPILIFLIFFARDLITLYLSEKYSASAIVFAIFNLTLLLRINDYEDVIIASKKSFLLFRYYLIGFVFNLFAAYFLIKYFGYAGGAISIVASILLISVLEFRKSLHLLQCRFRDLVIPGNFIRTILIAAAIASLLYFLKVNYMTGLNIVFKTLILAISYFIMNYGIHYYFNISHFAELKEILMRVTNTQNFFQKYFRIKK